MRLWLAGGAIGIARWLEMLAYALWVLQETGSPLQVALTSFARLLPMLLMSALLSGWLEGRERRRILLVNLVAQTVMGLTMVAVTLAGYLTPGLVIAASVVGGVFWVIDQPVRRTLLAELVGLERVGLSMGLECAINQATRALGAVMGGLAVQLLGMLGVFAIAAGLSAAAFVLALAVPRPAPGTRVATGPRPRLLDGFTLVCRDPLLLGTALVTAIFNLWCFPYVALVPVLAEEVMGLSAAQTGMLMAVEGVAGCFAALAIAAWAAPRHFPRLYTAGPVVLLLANIPFALTADPWLAAVFQIGAGIGSASFAATQAIIPLLAAPPAARLRVTGVIITCIGLSPLGFFHAGLMGEWLGAQQALLLLSAEGLLAMALVVRGVPALISMKAPAPMAA